MTEKEKAIAYDEALKKASAAHKDEDRHLKAVLERIFSELKEESEDERVKRILHAISSKMSFHLRDIFTEEEFQCFDAWSNAWLEKQGKQASSQINERAWLYLVSDVLTWKDGIGQYLDDPRVQELAKRLCSEYSQKLYNPSNAGKNERKSADKIEPRFKIGDWVVNKFGDSWHIDSLDKKNYQVSDGKRNYNYFPISKQDEIYLWTIQDAKDGDILACKDEILLFKSYSALQGRISLYCWYNEYKNNFHSKEVIDILLTTTNKVCPATKEQRDTFMKVMNDAGYEWDADKKELKKKCKR